MDVSLTAPWSLSRPYPEAKVSPVGAPNITTLRRFGPCGRADAPANLLVTIAAFHDRTNPHFGSYFRPHERHWDHVFQTEDSQYATREGPVG